MFGGQCDHHRHARHLLNLAFGPVGCRHANCARHSRDCPRTTANHAWYVDRRERSEFHSMWSKQPSWSWTAMRDNVSRLPFSNASCHPNVKSVKLGIDQRRGRLKRLCAICQRRSSNGLIRFFCWPTFGRWRSRISSDDPHCLSAMALPPTRRSVHIPISLAIPPVPWLTRGQRSPHPFLGG